MGGNEDQQDDQPLEESGERLAGAFTAVVLGSGFEEEDDGFRGLNIVAVIAGKKDRANLAR